MTACLDSILEQQYTNFEVLAVDDNSTDASSAILERYCEKDQRIKAFKNSGVGIIAALQVAYAKCKGIFITRMDSDDIMTPNKLDVLVNSLLKHKEGHIAIGLVQYFSKEGIHNGYLKYQQWLNFLTTSGSNYSEIYKECVVPSPCWMVYKSDFDLCGGFERDTYPEDYDLAFRFYAHKLKCIPCKEILHFWRDYSTRTSRTSEHYAENNFLDLKLHYFLKIDHDKSKKLVVWGAGKKGKTVAQKLTKRGLSFQWVCDNEKKIGKHIYGIEMQSPAAISKLKSLQVLVTVANQEDQKNITSFLQKNLKSSSLDYYFFC